MLNQNMVIVIWLNYVVSYAEEQGHLCVFVTSKREVTEAPCRRVTFITSCEIIDTSSAPKTWEKRMPAFTLSPLQVRQIKSGMWIDSETSNSKRRHCNYLNRCVRAKSIHFKGQIQSVKSSSLRIICRGCAEHVSKGERIQVTTLSPHLQSVLSKLCESRFLPEFQRLQLRWRSSWN